MLSQIDLFGGNAMQTKEWQEIATLGGNQRLTDVQACRLNEIVETWKEILLGSTDEEIFLFQLSSLVKTDSEFGKSVKFEGIEQMDVSTAIIKSFIKDESNAFRVELATQFYIEFFLGEEFFFNLVRRTMNILRDGDIDSPVFEEELEFAQSSEFREWCEKAGKDSVEVKEALILKLSEDKNEASRFMRESKGAMAMYSAYARFTTERKGPEEIIKFACSRKMRDLFWLAGKKGDTFMNDLLDGKFISAQSAARRVGMGRKRFNQQRRRLKLVKAKLSLLSV